MNVSTVRFVALQALALKVKTTAFGFYTGLKWHPYGCQVHQVTCGICVEILIILKLEHLQNYVSLLIPFK